MALLEAGGQELPAVLMMRRAELMADAGDLAGAAKLAEAAANADPARGLLVRFADIARRSDDPAAAARAYERLEAALGDGERSEEHTSELQSLMRISYAVFCLIKKNNHKYIHDQPFTL